MRFVLERDRKGTLEFAPLQGETLRGQLPAATRDALPDSLVILTADGSLLTRSTSVVALLRYLGGAWGVLGSILGFIPRFLRDGGYRFVAAIRHRIFKKPENLCPILPPEVRARFLP